MTTAIDAHALASLLDDLVKWLRDHPGEDLQDFADEHNCSIDDISDSWNTYFSADFSRNYKIDNDNDYHPQHPPHGDPHALKSYIVREVNTYQQYTTVNNIEDNSFNQQIIADDVHQDIDIDNSDNIADHGGVVVRDSDLDDSNINTGDRAVVDSDHSNVLTGDVSSSADDGSTAASNINFGSGNSNTTSTTDDHSDNSAHDSFNLETDNSVSTEDSFNTHTDVDTDVNTDVDTTTTTTSDSSTHVDASDHSDNSIDDSFNTHI